jgi:hypothetical protein
MKNAVITTKKAAAERKKALLEKIKYDPAKATKAWEAIAGVWEARNDIDPTTVRQEAWSNTK